MLVGSIACSCGRHLTWRCECDAVTYGPALGDGCSLLDGPAPRPLAWPTNPAPTPRRESPPPHAHISSNTWSPGCSWWQSRQRTDRALAV